MAILKERDLDIDMHGAFINLEPLALVPFTALLLDCDSRYPITQTASHSVEMERPLLEADIQVFPRNVE